LIDGDIVIVKKFKARHPTDVAVPSRKQELFRCIFYVENKKLFCCVQISLPTLRSKYNVHTHNSSIG